MKPTPLRIDPRNRLLSLDVLRGFDMFWITGGGSLAIVISRLTGWEWLGKQMHHVNWEGFHFYDLIFPLFMFISGIAIPYAIESKLDKNVPRRRLLSKAFLRFVVLVGLGLVYNGALSEGFTGLRVASVLGQIGFGYFIASLIVIYFRSYKIRLTWLGAILLFVTLLQLVFPVPGSGAGVLTPEGCVNGFIDRMLLPGKLYREVFDPEGLLCCVSAAGITLMGTFAGNILRKKQAGDWKKIGMLSATGVALIVAALIISPWYPVIKSCWTTTFNLLAGGIGFLLIALSFLVVDHWRFRKSTFYFRVIGMNSIFIYLFYRIVDVKRISEFFTGWVAKLFMEPWSQFVTSVGILAVVWFLLYYMYRKEIFIRI
jgi:predicted acyltransferase